MVSAVIVTYEPDENKLKKLVFSLINQVSNLIIVNNGGVFDTSYIKDDFFHRVHIEKLSRNFGIATAQNIGISIAVSFNSQYTLLLDQDSVVPESMVSDLILGFANRRVAAVGPTVVDSRKKDDFVYYLYGKWKRVNSLKKPPFKNTSFYETDCLISSGTIVNNDIFMDNKNKDDLFIEFVDVEWCLRIRSRGYIILFSESTKMPHELGDSREKLLGVEFPLHRPERYFYVTRNSIYCAVQSIFPLWFRVYTMFRLIVLISLVLVKSKNKISVIKNVAKGIMGVRKIL